MVTSEKHFYDGGLPSKADWETDAQPFESSVVSDDKVPHAIVPPKDIDGTKVAHNWSKNPMPVNMNSECHYYLAECWKSRRVGDTSNAMGLRLALDMTKQIKGMGSIIMDDYDEISTLQ